MMPGQMSDQQGEMPTEREYVAPQGDCVSGVDADGQFDLSEDETPTINPAGIPDELKNLPTWCVWKRIQDGDTVKKTPLSPVTGYTIGPNETHYRFMTDFQTAYRYAMRHGYGVALSIPPGRYTFFDYDGVVSPDGVISPSVVRELQVLNSYTEFSQSGRGIHVLVRGQPEYWGDVIQKPYHHDGSIYGNTPRFIYLTGHVVHGYPSDIIENPDGLKEVFSRRKNWYDAVHPPKKVTHVTGKKKHGKWSGSVAEFFGISISDFMPDKPNQIRPGVWQGGHPIHGSKTGTNYAVDLNTGSWWCWAHARGGDPGSCGGALKIWAISRGLFQCDRFSCPAGGHSPDLTKEEWKRVFDELEVCYPEKFKEWKKLQEGQGR